MASKPLPTDKYTASKNEPFHRIFDEKTETNYRIGRFLGKGGFAKCYEFQNMDTKKIYAGKVVSKSLLAKDIQKEKMTQEIIIHRSLSHEYIVEFYSFFEDEKNIYIILELCRNRSLMEMQKRRKTLTENEVRYFLRQILLACIYLHENKVIHRDLKLGNLFIDDNMQVKVGDFGLATRVGFDGERKKTLCGTPNYIAPEILTKRGHSYEVDVWSLGCIMYTLLVGVPPFETNTLKETYSKIRRNDYHIPSKVSYDAGVLLQKMLKSEPSERPTMSEILYSDTFFTSGYLLRRLPTSCLTMPPLFKNSDSSKKSRKPLVDLNKDLEKGNTSPAKIDKLQIINQNIESKPVPTNEETEDCYLHDLHQLLKSVIENFPHSLKDMYDEALDPAAIPFIWISKWVDYTDKYGLGYQLCDNSIGVLFNDGTRLIILSDTRNFYYIDFNGNKMHHQLPVYPPSLDKKITLMKYFRNYMADHLQKAGEKVVPRAEDEIAQVPYLRAWDRTKHAMVFHLTNGTLQINFFEDHTKLILCPLMGAVSFIDENKEFLVYKLNLIEKYGCPSPLFKRLQYAQAMVERLTSSQIVCGKVLNGKSSGMNYKRTNKYNNK